MPSPLPPIRGLVRDDLRTRAAFSEAAGIHRLVPACVARPVDTDDVAALVRWAGETGTALVPRGAGSSMGGGAVGTGCLVDLRDLPRTLEIDAERRTAQVSPNITLGELNDAATAVGLRFPVDPSSRRWATVGGTLSTNAAGARTVRDGPMRAWTEALELVDGRGDRLLLGRDQPAPSSYAALDADLRAARRTLRDAFPDVRKNTCGYALDHAARGGLHHLPIGAEGTLGVVTAATLALAPLPAARRALRLALPALEALPEVVALLLPHAPAAVELLDRSFLALAAPAIDPALREALADADAVLLVDLEGDAAALDAQLDALTHALQPLDVTLAVAQTADEAAALWALRHAASPILAGLGERQRSLQVVEDGCVPVARLADYIRAVRGACERAGVPFVCFGHAGDGHLHVNLLPRLDDPDFTARIAGVYAEVHEAVLALGGTPSGEHGDGRLRAPLVPRCYDAPTLALMARVKAAFDPHGICNPGVKLDRDGTDPFAHLKVGPAAAPIPADIEAGLRRIERERGWGTDRLAVAAHGAEGVTPGIGH